MPEITRSVMVTRITRVDTEISANEVEKILREALNLPADAHFNWDTGIDYVNYVTAIHTVTEYPDGAA